MSLSVIIIFLIPLDPLLRYLFFQNITRYVTPIQIPKQIPRNAVHRKLITLFVFAHLHCLSMTDKARAYQPLLLYLTFLGYASILGFHFLQTALEETFIGIPSNKSLSAGSKATFSPNILPKYAAVSSI